MPSHAPRSSHQQSALTNMPTISAPMHNAVSRLTRRKLEILLAKTGGYSISPLEDMRAQLLQRALRNPMIMTFLQVELGLLSEASSESASSSSSSRASTTASSVSPPPLDPPPIAYNRPSPIGTSRRKPPTTRRMTRDGCGEPLVDGLP